MVFSFWDRFSAGLPGFYHFGGGRCHGFPPQLVLA
jgi:hypothetical protein